jgi:hypothetical protein
VHSRSDARRQASERTYQGAGGEAQQHSWVLGRGGQRQHWEVRGRRLQLTIGGENNGLVGSFLVFSVLTAFTYLFYWKKLSPLSSSSFNFIFEKVII